jgi:hemoglobin
MKRWLGWAVLLPVVAVTFAACATTDDKQAAKAEPSPSLYKRLGGREGIRGVVDDFVAFVVADPRVNARFKDLKPPDVEKLKTNVSDQVCSAAGGPCTYLGRDMKTVHKGMNITEAEWGATVEDLVKALDKRNVAKKDQDELLLLLGPLKKDIVGQ